MLLMQLSVTVYFHRGFALQSCHHRSLCRWYVLTIFLKFFGNLEIKFILAESGYRCTFLKTSPTHLDWLLHEFIVSEIKPIFSEDIQRKKLKTLNTIPKQAFQTFAENYSSQVSHFDLFGLSLEYSFLRKSSKPQYLVFLENL